MLSIIKNLEYLVKAIRMPPAMVFHSPSNLWRLRVAHVIKPPLSNTGLHVKLSTTASLCILGRKLSLRSPRLA